ncbi:MAG: glycosyl hydrolase family protein [Bacteroidetes bacterium]|nr:MAG: glycosyl hydrolase family protein [Bacteroidota bacterium]
MFLSFPDYFLWGTSTAAAQVETAGDHPWRGLTAKDGYRFERTTDHEKRREEDAAFITRFGSVYRCGVDWSRLQPAPLAKFDPAVVDEYCTFFEYLKKRGVSLMFVLHHFCHPNWFEDKGGWTKEQNIEYFVNYTQQCIKYFGKYAGYWNTFNEPNVYAYNAFFSGDFPPHKKGKYLLANRVLDNMGQAHDIARLLIREKHKKAPVGISLNTASFEAANIWGVLPVAFSRWWFMTRAFSPFRKSDFIGLSYYAHVLFDPLPVDTINRPDKVRQLDLPHDKMWLYNPAGLGQVLRNFWQKYRKPIIITENGICTDDDRTRVQAIRDYLGVCHAAIQDGVDLRGYIHWSTWDNFEWHLGPTYRFGLVRVNLDTMERTMTGAGLFYEQVVLQGGVEV